MDIVDRQTRSRMMAGIRGKNTKPELRVRTFLHRSGIRYRLHDRSLPGRPDLVLKRHHAVVEVRGCFWHQHPGCRLAYTPASNTEFWSDKLLGNVARDKRNEIALRELGFRVFVVWECEAQNSAVLEDLVAQLRDLD